MAILTDDRDNVALEGQPDRDRARADADAMARRIRDAANNAWNG